MSRPKPECPKKEPPSERRRRIMGAAADYLGQIDMILLEEEKRLERRAVNHGVEPKEHSREEVPAVPRRRLPSPVMPKKVKEEVERHTPKIETK